MQLVFTPSTKQRFRGAWSCEHEQNEAETRDYRTLVLRYLDNNDKNKNNNNNGDNTINKNKRQHETRHKQTTYIKISF
nr:unnamed protein product [Fasciola hepatica]